MQWLLSFLETELQMWKRRGWMMYCGFLFTLRGYCHFSTATDTSSVPRLMFSGGSGVDFQACGRAPWPPTDTRWWALKVALFCCHVWTDGSLMLQGCNVVICSLWLCACDKHVWSVITSGKHFRTCSKCPHVKNTAPLCAPIQHFVFFLSMLWHLLYSLHLCGCYCVHIRPSQGFI